MDFASSAATRGSVRESLFWPVTIITALYTLSTSLFGIYDKITSLLIWLWEQVFDRQAYQHYAHLKKSLRNTRWELARISAQDEFAKWARKRRQLDKLTSEYEAASVARNQKNGMKTLTLEFLVKALAVALIAVQLKKHLNVAVMSLGFIEPGLQDTKLEWLGRLLVRVLALPFAPRGSLSLVVWVLAVHVAVKRLVTSH